MEHMALVEHREVGASGDTWSETEYVILPQIDDVQWYIQTHPPVKITLTTVYTVQ